jgi:hypothetical protein
MEAQLEMRVPVVNERRAGVKRHVCGLLAVLAHESVGRDCPVPAEAAIPPFLGTELE